MLQRQLFDRPTCTYVYLLADDQTRQAVIIDSVLEVPANQNCGVHPATLN